jgi:ribonucleoside-diphosphate reductase alpha chain
MEAFQQFTDEAVSKTINLPESVTEEEAQNIFRYVLESKYLKGISIYKSKSRKNQPITF